MEETREQQQMYDMFRSCIYVILIVEIVMNLPITSDNRMIAFVHDVFHRFTFFDSVATCKVMELVCITVTCIGTRARKSLKWNLKTMVLYPVIAGATMIVLCFVFYGMQKIITTCGNIFMGAARDFTPTERSSFSSINLEESPEFKTTKYF